MEIIITTPKVSGYWEMFYEAAVDHTEDLGGGKKQKSDSCMRKSNLHSK